MRNFCRESTSQPLPGQGTDNQTRISTSVEIESGRAKASNSVVNKINSDIKYNCAADESPKVLLQLQFLSKFLSDVGYFRPNH